MLTSEASLVPVAWIWNAMVPRLEMATTLRNLDVKVTPVTVVPALAVLLKQVTLKASKKPENSVTSIALVATMASLASVAPVARMALASLDLVALMVWVTDLNRRELCNVMLEFTPLKIWICSLTKQAWDAEGSRSSRRVDVAKVKKELTGSQIWSVVVTWPMMASMASMVASMESKVASMASIASMTSMELMVVSMALMDAPMAPVGLGGTKDVDGPGFGGLGGLKDLCDRSKQEKIE